LFAKHCKECSEERKTKTGIQQGLNLDSCIGRTGPLWDCRGVSTKSGVIELVEENAKESGGLFAWVWLEPGMNLDNEGGSHCGEQTGLRP